MQNKQLTGQAIGEASIPEGTVDQTVPEANEPQGQAQLLAKLISANKLKNMLDSAFELAAKHIGATFNSRVKHAENAVKKVAQKRLQGRDYDIGDINDAYGGRFVVDSPKDISKVKSQMDEMAKIGLFIIKKEESITHGTYKSYHFDIETPDGHRGEVQIHTAQSELSAEAEHDLRALYGENPKDENIEKLRKAQDKMAKSMPSNRARLVTEALTQLHKQNDNQPISPQITATVLQSAK